jgi:hypothetical protein
VPAGDFKTIPDELLHVAADAESHFENEGYAVDLEKREIGFPFTPAIVCRRGHETVIVEVYSSLDRQHADRWIRYCKSQTVDTRFCAFVRSTAPLDQSDIAYAHEMRMGLRVHNDTSHIEVRPPLDLGVHVALPNLRDLPTRLRPLLGGAFKKINENDWRDGLNEAYAEVEQHARDYLKAGIASGRIIIARTRNRVVGVVTVEDAEKMTLGEMKNAFGNIQNQNHKDSVIGGTLAMINQTRVGLAHKRRAAAVEAALRLQVGQHMYAVITCLEELTS